MEKEIINWVSGHWFDILSVEICILYEWCGASVSPIFDFIVTVMSIAHLGSC